MNIDKVMMYIIIIIELVKLFVVISNIIGLRLCESKMKYIVFIVLFSVLTIMLSYTNLRFVYYEIIIMYLFAILIFDEKLWVKVLVCTFCESIISAVETFILAVVNAVLELNYKLFYISDLVRILINVFGLVLICVISLFWSKRKKDSSIIFNAPRKYIILTFIVLLSINFLSGIVQTNSVGIINKNIKTAGIITFLVAVILVILLCLLFLFMVRSRNNLKKISELSEKIIEDQKRYYETNYQKDLDLRKFRHDYNAHMYVLKELSKKEDHNELLQYINDLIEVSESFKRISTGNTITDAVVNSIYEIAQRDKIEFICVGKLPSDIGIKDIDLCVLFSNALKNAIEAVEKQPPNDKRYIYLEISNYRGSLYITINNSINPDGMGNIYKTSKEDYVNHGFGIELMKTTLKKYKGKIDFIQKENEFETRIMI